MNTSQSGTVIGKAVEGGEPENGETAGAIVHIRSREGLNPALDFGAAWEYAPAPETVKVQIADRYGLFIDGKWIEPRSGKKRGDGGVFATINPATEQALAQITQAGAADVDAAVAAARRAQPKWAALPGKERGKFLFRIARRIQERARELAILETMNGGKPIRESRDVDVPLAAQHFFYHAGWADKLEYAFPGWSGGSAPGGSALQSGARNARLGRAVPPPVGVCGQIIPWNFPLLMAAWKIAPALACGNTVVLKPAETTSLTALRLAEICDEVGLPPGVVNIVTGDGRTGAAIVNHPGIDKIAFTGSTEVGKKIALEVARHSVPGARGQPAKAKRLTLELGGKSANIIFDDASIDQAVEGIVQGIYFNQGHVCCAGSRLFVQEGVLDEVTAKLAIRLASLRVGDPMDKNTDLGAINSRAQLEKIEGYLATGEAEGAELCVPGSGSRPAASGSGKSTKSTSGTRSPEPGTRGLARAGLPERGFWCRPCFFKGVQPSHTIAREEIFGPVLAVMSFRTPEEAITRANNSPYGLAAGVWTDKGSKIFEIARKLEAGVVWLNTYNKFDAASPFGGFKESGFGREGGMQGLRGYVEV
ncbi:MAG: aldehyde dehydrogenase family protein [Phycisphaeraceae bacterium]|nr:aldehyde dehydrogenase family protein [Phycisphaeraceae bacterium]